MSKALVVLSGGQDSTTCLFLAKNKHDEVHTISFSYGQKHKIELESAKIVSTLAYIKDENKHVVFIPNNFFPSSALTDINKEIKSFRDKEICGEEIQTTFVPGRNLFFLNVAAMKAYEIGAEAIYTGVCQEESGGYPDCTSEFINSCQTTINEAFFGKNNKKRIKIETPLINLTKKQIVELAYSMPECWDAMKYTLTCYRGEWPKPCGTCHSCLLRAKGFKEAGLLDPLLEEDEK